jgi:hypothetical protein
VASRGRRALLAALVLVGLRLCAARSAWAEVLAQGPLGWVGVGLSRASGLLPFSLAEPLLVLAVALVVLRLVVAFRLYRGAGSLGPLSAAVLQVVTWALAVFVVFFLLFGVDYYRPPLSARLSWSGTDATKLREAARAAVELGNREYREAFGHEDIGSPTPLPLRLDERLEGGYRVLGSQLGMGELFRAGRAEAKPILASAVLCRLGLSGFFFPWTGEANFNRLVPACELSHTIAHEKAHQRAVAREDEANFVGALACLFSGDPAVRYGGALFAENDLLRELSRRRDPELGRLLSLRAPGVVRDVEAEAAFWRRYQGLASQVSEAVNDTYLKAQGVREGTGSYAESPRLLILFFDRFCAGGRCGNLPEPGPS